MAAEWIIETHDLTRVYGDGVEIRALDGVSIQVAPGEFISVMGPSGSGKSTLLNMLGALDLPTSGEVFVNGKNIRDIRNKDDFRARTVGFVFQLHNLIPTLTAHENIEVPMVGHLPHSQRHERARELLTLVGLGDRLNHLPNQLSGGQRQRVAVARALANKPPLILADEPTGSLDTTSGQELMHLLREINQTLGTTFIVVTHDPAVARQTNRVLVMQDGRVAREDVIGSPFEEDLKMWRHSALGKSLVEGNTNPFGGAGLSGEELKALTGFLQQANSE